MKMKIPVNQKKKVLILQNQKIKEIMKDIEKKL